MAELSYQQFTRDVRERPEKFSEKELREFILSLASDESPAKRGTFLAKLTLPLVDLYLIAHEDDYFETVRLAAEARINELLKAGKGDISNYSRYDNEQNTAWIPQELLYNSWLLGGNYEKVFEKCKG